MCAGAHTHRRHVRALLIAFVRNCVDGNLVRVLVRVDIGTFMRTPEESAEVQVQAPAWAEISHLRVCLDRSALGSDSDEEER